MFFRSDIERIKIELLSARTNEIDKVNDILGFKIFIIIKDSL